MKAAVIRWRPKLKEKDLPMEHPVWIDIKERPSLFSPLERAQRKSEWLVEVVFVPD